MPAVKPCMREWAAQMDRAEREIGARPMPAPPEPDDDPDPDDEPDGYDDGLCFYDRHPGTGEPLETGMDIVRKWERIRERRIAGDDNPYGPELPGLWTR